MPPQEGQLWFLVTMIFPELTGGRVQGIIIIANHMVSSTFALVRWWLDTDMAESPEVMGEIRSRLITQPVLDIILQAVSE